MRMRRHCTHVACRLCRVASIRDFLWKNKKHECNPHQSDGRHLIVLCGSVAVHQWKKKKKKRERQSVRAKNASRSPQTRSPAIGIDCHRRWLTDWVHWLNKLQFTYFFRASPSFSLVASSPITYVFLHFFYLSVSLPFFSPRATLAVVSLWRCWLLAMMASGVCVRVRVRYFFFHSSVVHRWDVQRLLADRVAFFFFFFLFIFKFCSSSESNGEQCIDRERANEMCSRFMQQIVS